jgi:acyl-CoA synthetase (AMP-forming)/AMP-acid ligase II
VARLLADRGLTAPGNRVGLVRRPDAAFVAATLACVRSGTPYTVVEAGAVADPPTGISAVLDAAPVGDAPEGTVDLGAVLRGPDDPGAPVTPPAAAPAGTDWAVERFGLCADDRLAVLSPQPARLLAAVSTAYAAGAALVLPADPAADADALVSWLHERRITVLHVNPPLLRALAAARHPLPALRHVFVDNAGDLIAHDVELVRRLAPAGRCVGVYGADGAGRPLAAHAVPEDWDLATAPLRVPLGHTVTDPPLRLVTSSGAAAAVGEVAEISVGDRPTGDLGRRRPDGIVEFVDAGAGEEADEPIEVVGGLRDAPEVGDALVTRHVDQDGRSLLVGYVAGPDPAGGVAQVHQHLVKQLPDFLLPHHLFVLDRLPLTPEGEYDRAALPEPDAGRAELDTYVAPRTTMERQLVKTLHNLLDVPRIGVYDSFFELGGFSLLATRLASRIREDFHVELQLRDLFTHATVDQLARLIVQAQAEQAGVDDLESLLDELTR